MTVSLNHQNIRNHPEEISKNRPFISKYNRKGMDFPPGSKDWKKFEQSNKTIALNILFAPHKKDRVIRNAIITNQNIIASVKIK